MRFRRRLLLLYVVFCAAIGVIWLRALQMQLVDGEHWAARAQELRQTRVPLDAPRGPIRSADGVLLAHDTSVFQLAVVCWEWKHRGRARCSACGVVHFQGAGGRLPRRCACGAGPSRGGPRLARETWVASAAGGRSAGRMERLPDGDLGPLEDALGVTRGELAQRADERVKAIELLVAAYEKRLRRESDDSDFLIDDKVELRQRDLMMRPHVIEADVSEAALRLLQTDETGRFRGFRVEGTLRRRYPLGDFAPHLLGYTSAILTEDEYERLKARFPGQITYSTRVGRRGLERAYNWSLHGKPGGQLRELEAGRGFSRVVNARPSEPGRALDLSIHAGLSRDAERILSDWATPDRYLPAGIPSAAFVMLDAATGEILLWAEQPRFDLNEDLDTLYDPSRLEARPDPDGAHVWFPRHPLEAGLTLEAWRSELVVPVPRSLSRVAQVAVEPGSTFKPLIALGLLDSRHPLLYDWYECNGGRLVPKCHGEHVVDLVAAIAVSCNRYFALSLRDGPGWGTYRHSVGAFIQRFGIGEKPGGEIEEWSRGQWLWPWVDFPLEQALDVARARLRKKLGAAAPRLRLTAHPRTPASVGGDPERLGRKLAAVAAHVARLSKASEVAVHVTREGTVGRQAILRIGLRAAQHPPWTVLPEARADALPAILRGRPAAKAGVSGAVARGGTVWFTVEVERHVGRTDPQSPPVIRADDGRNVAIGQGPVLVTPLQMARAMAPLANGGVLVEPHAVRTVGGVPVRPKQEALGLDPQHVALVRQGMYRVVNDEAVGTARKQAWHLVPATVYGKTGTAQVGRTWRPFEAEDGGPWHHWFVGFAEAPGRRTVAFACVLHSRTESAAGGTAAGATQQILARFYTSAFSQEGR